MPFTLPHPSSKPWLAAAWIQVVLVAVLLLRAPAVGAEGLGSRQVEADEQLAALQRSSNLVARAFVRDTRIELYFTNQTQRLMVKASWDTPRVKTTEFNYTAATLEGEKTPPAMPGLGKGWKEVRVLDRSESEQALRSILERLVPTEAGHGIYCRYGFGELLLFRDSQGQIQVRSAGDHPADIQIDRHYTRPELASAIATRFEEDLRASYPGQRGLVVVLGRTNQVRLVFVDLTQRVAVVLYPPQVGHDPRRSAKLALKLSTLASFVFVDNVWTFFKNPVSCSGRTINQFHQWLATLFEPRLRSTAASVPAVAGGPGMDLKAWEQWLDEHSHAPRERGSVRLLVDGDQFFPLIERRIAEAQHNVNIHVCIFDRDDVATEFADLLKERANAIEVKIIFDRLNSRGAGNSPPATPLPPGFSEPRSINRYLRRGGEVAVRPQANPGFTCDHSKVFLVDGRYAYIGGMNIGREYRYEWHDMMAEIEGPIVASYQRQFDKKWAQVGIWGDCGLAAQAICGNHATTPEAAAPPAMMELRRLSTKTFDRQIRRAKLAAIERATHHVYLENAYLYNNELVLALVRARLRGVDVRVVMPSENDFGAGHKSNLVTANYLLAHGIRVYFYPGMSHIKALDVDGWVCFGSANSDSLSLRLNRESDLATSDPEFARLFQQTVFERDFQKSQELQEAIETGFGDHLADALLNPF